MSSLQKGSSKAHCFVCQIDFSSDADYAIHEFSKKHCDNLLRLSKNKPVKHKSSKQPETKADQQNSEQTLAVPQEPGQLSLYGYFTPGDAADPSISYAPKEYNYEYDPYLQKLAENPLKHAAEKGITPVMPTSHVTSFSRNKKKKVRMCQICNVTLYNIPEYEAHMKSSQHTRQLKLTGMGASAHFVKASADLHTTENAGEENLSSSGEVRSQKQSNVPIAPLDLYCEICEVILNSQSQYQGHLSGKSHSDKFKQKERDLARRAKIEIPSPNQLFCYSCKLTVCSISQFHEHKNGKKHKLKCKNLVRAGFTIPPEERTVDMTWAVPKPGRPAVYPEHYQVKNSGTEENAESVHEMPNTTLNVGYYPLVNTTTTSQTENVSSSEANNGVVTLSKTVGYQCRICDVTYNDQPIFELHLNSEEHACKILELRNSGCSIADILEKLLADRRTILPDRYGRYVCGICAIISSNAVENEQHLSCVLHQRGEKEYEKKRVLEISVVPMQGPNGLYSCGHCSESWPTLVEFNVHLHNTDHKALVWTEYSKKIAKKRKFRWQLATRKDEERNPGVRTKVSGLATDLASGVVKPVPNLEELEPKIEPTKNVTLGQASALLKKKKISPTEPPDPERLRLPSAFPRHLFNPHQRQIAPRWETGPSWY